MIGNVGKKVFVWAGLVLCVAASAAQAATDAAAQPSQAQAAAPTGADWLKDPETGCAVFNIDPQPGKSIRWSGACKDGYAQGRGVLKWQDGSGGNVVYHRGKLSGHFAYTWKNGFHYLGDWVDGKRQGKGALTWPDGDRYEGDWVDGKRSGNGVFTKVSGEKQDGAWYDDKFIQ